MVQNTNSPTHFGHLVFCWLGLSVQQYLTLKELISGLFTRFQHVLRQFQQKLQLLLKSGSRNHTASISPCSLGQRISSGPAQIQEEWKQTLPLDEKKCQQTHYKEIMCTDVKVICGHLLQWTTAFMNHLLLFLCILEYNV